MVRRLNPVIAATAVTALLAGGATAQESKDKTRSFTADLGFLSSSGNASVTSVNLGDKLTINTADKKVVFTQLFNAVRSEADGEKSAENYRAQLRLDYGLGKRLFVFGLTGWDRNVPAGVDSRFEETFGLALKVVSLPTNELTVEAGLSMFQQKNTSAPVGASRSDNFTAARVAAAFKQSFTQTSFISQLLELIPNLEDGDDFRFSSESAAVALVAQNIGLKIGYVIRFDNLPGLRPPPNLSGERFKKTDRYLTAGITVAF
jgi:putative salt-induced outer membrane protein YdiY